MSRVIMKNYIFNIGLTRNKTKLIGRHFISNKMNEKKILNINCINPLMKNIEYAVRGPIVELATKLEDELNKGIEKPYKKVIKANIGDCHATGQSPITFIRQVLAACSYPLLMKTNGLFPEDVINRANQILNSCKGSIGCYSESLGTNYIRKQVANYIENRDGYPCNYENIFLTNGASAGIKMVIYSLMTNKNGKEQTGIMVPVPQYPLYSASINEFGGHMIKYYLDEKNNWELNIDELEKKYEIESKICKPRAIVVINPGNPTGQVLSYDNIQNIIKFAKNKNLLIMADEVYQHNIYNSNLPFYSFKKVLNDMGNEYNNMELVSFHSVSKGFYGECGIRGGYLELFNIDSNIQYQYYKYMSTNLGSTMPGQVVMSCIVSPPEIGDESYRLYKKERDTILDQLNKKANKIYKRLNNVDGISCNPVYGALYAFPQIHMSNSAIEAAKKQNMEPDFFYCKLLLKEKGVCLVPGSGFEQIDGTYHFRVTILPTIKEVDYILDAINDFHTKFKILYP